jgi:flagellar basal-body rod protein FlgC
MSFWNSLKISSSALSAQRLRMDVIANNVANVETTHTEETGQAYQRKDVVFSTKNANLPFAQNLLMVNEKLNRANVVLDGVQVKEIVTDESEGTKVYDPTHIDADEDGYVTYPNVNIAVEMTNMISASRSYEANLAVIESTRRMAETALQIGG